MVFVRWKMRMKQASVTSKAERAIAKASGTNHSGLPIEERCRGV